MEKRMLIVLGLLCIASASAANYYVTPTGSGAKSGVDWNNALAGLPANLERASTYYIADGSYGSYTFDDSDSGNKVITVKKATADEHGTGAGWIDGLGDGYAEFSSVNIQSNFIVIDGQKGRFADGWPGYEPYGIKVLLYATWDNAAVVQIGGCCQPGSAKNNITLKHVEVAFKNTPISGIWPRYSTNIQGYGNDWTFQYIWSHNAGQSNIYFMAVQRSLVEDSFIEHNCMSQEAMNWDPWEHCALVRYNYYSSDVIFRNNIIKDFRSSGGLILAGGNSNIEIYGNVFMITDGSRFDGGGNGVLNSYAPNDYPKGQGSLIQGAKIYHNTFADIPSRGATVATIGTWSASTEIKNNLFSNMGGSFSINFGTDHSHNSFYLSGSLSEPGIQILTEEIFRGNRDFRLKMPTSPGIQLDAKYNTDAYGLTRGLDGIRDRGAYEFSSSGPCVNECTGGARQCSGNGYQTCGNYDSDSCLEWGSVTACPSGQACSGGVCTSACTPAWNCSSWTSCINSLETRACQDTNNCGTTAGKPAESQSCSASNLILNGGFESGFMSGRANGWTIQSDGSIGYTLSEDTGYQGSSQKVSVSFPGSWGLFLYQNPVMELGKHYELSFWYKSSATFFAQVCNSPQSVVVLDSPLTAVNQWTKASLRFEYSYDLANQVRFYMSQQGSFWIDEVALREVSCHESDTDCDGCVRHDELMQYISSWKNGQKALAQLMEAIGRWKNGC